LKQISAQTGLSVRTISRFKQRAKLDRLDILNMEPERIDAAIIEVIPLINELYLQGFKTVEVPHYLNNPGENRRPVANPSMPRHHGMPTPCNGCAGALPPSKRSKLPLG